MLSLSHTAVQLWRENRPQFFLAYVAEHKTPKPPQDRPAAVGSAFDSFIKGRLSASLSNANAVDPLELFGASVEAHNAAFAADAGGYIADAFEASANYKELLYLLKRADAVRFESKVKREIDGVTFKGYPDVYARIGGQHYLDDFKVRGYCGSGTTSPTKGYVFCVDGPHWPKPSRSHLTTHKDCELSLTYDGVGHSVTPLEQISGTYAQQLSIYGWLCGVAVGAPLLAGIQEVACKGNAGGRPLLRFASYRAYISPDFQRRLFDECAEIWRRVQAREIFDTDNDKTCAALDDAAKHLSENPDDEYAAETRGGRWSG